jgi:ribosomal protein S27E
MRRKKYHCPVCGNMLIGIIPEKVDLPTGKKCFDTGTQCPDCKTLFMCFAYSSGEIITKVPQEAAI